MLRLLKMTLSGFLNVLDVVRYWDWYYIARVNLFALLILFLFVGNAGNFLQDIILYALYVHVVIAIGFLVNNYSDSEIDRRVGKSYLGTISKKKFYILLVSLILYVLFFIVFFNSNGITITVLISFFLGLGYSIRPIRFKERGFLGILAPMIAQQLSFIFFVFILPSASYLVIYLFVWLLLDGILIELEQQVADYKNDLQTGTKTFVTQLDAYRVKKVVLLFTSIFVVYMILPALALGLPGLTLSILLILFSSISLNHAQRSIAQLSTS